MLFRGASAMLRHQDPSAIEQKVDLDNLAREFSPPFESSVRRL